MARKLKKIKSKAEINEENDIIGKNLSYYVLVSALEHIWRGLFEQRLKIKYENDIPTLKHRELYSDLEPLLLPWIKGVIKARKAASTKETNKLIENNKLKTVLASTFIVFLQRQKKIFDIYTYSPLEEVQKSLDGLVRCLASADLIDDCLYSDDLKMDLKQRKYLRTISTKFKKNIKPEIILLLKENVYNKARYKEIVSNFENAGIKTNKKVKLF